MVHPVLGSNHSDLLCMSIGVPLGRRGDTPMGTKAITRSRSISSRKDNPGSCTYGQGDEAPATGVGWLGEMEAKECTRGGHHAFRFTLDHRARPNWYCRDDFHLHCPPPTSCSLCAVNAKTSGD